MSKWSVAAVGFLGGVMVSGLGAWLCGPVVVGIYETDHRIEITAHSVIPPNFMRTQEVVYQSNRYGQDGCWMEAKDLVVGAGQ